MKSEDDATVEVEVEEELDILFANERYVVYAAVFEYEVKSHGGTYGSGYSVINRHTGMTEVNSPQLPDAIAAAEQLDIAMSEEPWRWARLQSEANAVNPDGTPRDADPDTEVH